MVYSGQSRKLLLQSRQRIFRTASSALLKSYWQIGRLIVEDEQKGEVKAAYGKGLLKSLAEQLSLEFGKGFVHTNLTKMHKFFLAFPIHDALRHELSWTHYRLFRKG